jgi:hypothetical protein
MMIIETAYGGTLIVRSKTGRTASWPTSAAGLAVRGAAVGDAVLLRQPGQRLRARICWLAAAQAARSVAL